MKSLKTSRIFFLIPYIPRRLFSIVQLLFIVILWSDELPITTFIYLYHTKQIAHPSFSYPNLAISENGLLPYQLCTSTDSLFGAGIKYSSFIHDGIELLIAVTASSSWGEGARLPRVEFLAYFRPLSEHCPNNFGHCEIFPRGTPVISPNITCRVSQPGRPSRLGFFSVPAAALLNKNYDGIISVVNIMCPSLELDLPPSGKTQVEIYIGDEGSRTFMLNLCYIHISSLRRASICTEPLFGIGRNNTMNNAFWRGVTSVWPNGYHGHTLLDAFLKYHIQLLGLHVTINTYESDEFLPFIKKYLGPNFAYRPGWSLPGLGKSNIFHNYEIFSVATCQWEHRLDSQWVIALSAPDNFIFPRKHGETLDNVLDRLDPDIYSGVEIPMMLSHSRFDAQDEHKNVLQRWRWLDINDNPYHLDRSIPLVNPRHATHMCIHWNHAQTEEFRLNLVGLDVINKLSLSVLHIMALVRPKLNQIDAIERKDMQPWMDELGSRLQKELDDIKHD